MHAVTASGLDCSFSHPKRLGTPRVGEGNRSREAFRPHSSGIRPVRVTAAAAAAAAAEQWSAKYKQPGAESNSAAKPVKASFFQDDWETSARKPPLLQGVRCGYRGRTGRPTVGHAIGRRRADRSGSGVAPARIGRAAGIWDRDSLLAGVALWWFLVGSATNGDGQPQAKEGTE